MNMQNKIVMLITMFCIFFSIQAFALENPTSKINVKPIDECMAKKLINSQTDDLKNVGVFHDIEPDKQSFKINIKSNVFYIISGTRESKIRTNLHRCAILFFDEEEKIKGAISTVAPQDDESFWTCDGTAAMSFKDYYPDGSPKVIVLYNVTPPSNERFILPVILKLDLNKPSLKIDEALTRKLEDADVNTIQEVRSYLKKHEKK